MGFDITDIVTKMIGTLAVILILAAFIASSSLLQHFRESGSKLKYSIIAGIIGGLFGIYGNLSGAEFFGALISVRDIGPMMSGYLGGPIGGLLGGIIAGAHRLYIGGDTAHACIVATCIIGTLCGLMFRKGGGKVLRPQLAFVTGILMEMMHLIILLIMVRPLPYAFMIVKGIALPFMFVNATGFTLMCMMMKFIDDQRNLNAEQNRMASELSVAEKIQRSVLPVVDDSFPDRMEVQVNVFMEPAKEVGGDFYDVFFVDDTHMAFLIADVAGKGVPGALFMMTSKQMLQNCIKEYDSLSEAVEAANDKLCAGNEAEMFVTAWIGVLDIENGEVNCVNAGHNPPIISSAGEVRYLKQRGGLVLAGMEGAPYRENSFKLNENDIILLYTDGVTEAENEKNDQFGEDALLQAMESQGNYDCRSILRYLRKKVKEHAAGYEQSDDITMMCLKYIGNYMANNEDGGLHMEREYDVTFESIEKITSLAEQLMEQRELPMDVIYKFNISIDEMLSNIIKHSGADIMRVGFDITDKEVSMSFADNGIPFDPKDAPMPDIDADADARKIGGLGLYMVENMMDGFVYEYKDGFNIIRITKELS